MPPRGVLTSIWAALLILIFSSRPILFTAAQNDEQSISQNEQTTLSTSRSSSFSSRSSSSSSAFPTESIDAELLKQFSNCGSTLCVQTWDVTTACNQDDWECFCSSPELLEKLENNQCVPDCSIVIYSGTLRTVNDVCAEIGVPLPNSTTTTVDGENPIATDTQEQQQTERSEDEGGSSMNVGAVVGGTVGGAFGVALIVTFIWFFLKERKHRKETPEFVLADPQNGPQVVGARTDHNQEPPPIWFGQDEYKWTPPKIEGNGA